MNAVDQLNGPVPDVPWNHDRRHISYINNTLFLVSFQEISITHLNLKVFEAIMVVGDFPLDGKIAVVTGGGSGKLDHWP